MDNNNYATISISNELKDKYAILKIKSKKGTFENLLTDMYEEYTKKKTKKASKGVCNCGNRNP